MMFCLATGIVSGHSRCIIDDIRLSYLIDNNIQNTLTEEKKYHLIRAALH